MRDPGLPLSAPESTVEHITAHHVWEGTYDGDTWRVWRDSAEAGFESASWPRCMSWIEDYEWEHYGFPACAAAAEERGRERKFIIMEGV